MATKVKFRIVAGIAVFTLMLGVYTATFWSAYETSTNFQMYYTAACLVRSGMSTHIYDVVDPNTNPQQLFANPDSVFAQTARAHGFSRITLYLYPPTLADLIVPLTFLSASKALIIWDALDVLMILGLGLVLSRMLDIRFWGSTALIATALLLFRPTLNCIHWGQVTILLAFLVTVGFYSYVHEHKIIASLLFALAIAIKLEPIVVLVPLIVWRDWKSLRNVAIWGILLCLGIWGINGSNALSLYFMHQLPAMSGGITADVNRSLGNLFYTLLGGDHPVLSPRGLSWLVRVVSALVLLFAGWLSHLAPATGSSNRQRFEIGIIFLLFACCLSPYSWFYNWVLSAPAAVLFCKRTWDGRANTIETVLLAALLLSLSTSRFNMAMVTPVLGALLGMVGLYRMRQERGGTETSQPVKVLRAATVS